MEDQLNLNLVKLEEELDKLKSSVEYIESAKVTADTASKIINNMIDVKKEFEKLHKQASILITKIDKVDFPSRLDKLDTNISAINQNISNTQTRIESIERNLNKEIERIKIDIIAQLDKTDRNIENKFTSLKKQNRVNTYLLIFLIILALIGIYLTVFKI